MIGCFCPRGQAADYAGSNCSGGKIYLRVARRNGDRLSFFCKNNEQETTEEADKRYVFQLVDFIRRIALYQLH